MAQITENKGNIVNWGTAIGKSITAATRSTLGSIEYIQRITRSTFEHIIFSRINFDRSEFKYLVIDDKNYSVLRNSVKTPTLFKFKKMMDSLLNLLGRDYVKQVDMMFANVNNPDHPVEIYTLKFVVTDNNCENVDYHIQRKMTNTLRRNTSEIFENVSFLDDSYEVLHHEEIGIRFTILLRDRKNSKLINSLIKVKPDHLHEGEIALKNAENKYVNCFRLGKMKTGHHKISAGAKGEVYELFKEMETLQVEPRLNGLPSIETDSIPFPMQIDPSVKCLCCIAVKYDKIDMLCCSQCNTYQHGVCLFFRYKEEFPEWYSCPDCILQDVDKPATTDCLVRLVAAICHEYGKYPEYLFNQQPSNFKEYFIRYFIYLGFFTKLHNKYEVIREEINENFMMHMFGNPKDFPTNEYFHGNKRRRLQN